MFKVLNPKVNEIENEIQNKLVPLLEKFISKDLIDLVSVASINIKETDFIAYLTELLIKEGRKKKPDINKMGAIYKGLIESLILKELHNKTQDMLQDLYLESLPLLNDRVH